MRTLVLLSICDHITTAAILERYKWMILQWIEKKLKQRAFQERHKVIKLEWQKAELERKIAEAKRKKSMNDSLY